MSRAEQEQTAKICNGTETNLFKFEQNFITRSNIGGLRTQTVWSALKFSKRPNSKSQKTVVVAGAGRAEHRSGTARKSV